MSEVAHHPQQEPPDPCIISPARQRAQQRHIALYGEPQLTPLDELVDEPLANLTEERIARESEEVRAEVLDTWGQFFYGNRLCADKYQEIAAALKRYRRELDEDISPESRVLQISLLQKLLKGESIGIWSLESLIADARRDERSFPFTDEELTECFEKSMDLYARRGWIETVYPQNGPNAEGENLA